MLDGLQGMVTARVRDAGLVPFPQPARGLVRSPAPRWCDRGEVKQPGGTRELRFSAASTCLLAAAGDQDFPRGCCTAVTVAGSSTNHEGTGTDEQPRIQAVALTLVPLGRETCLWLNCQQR